MLPLLESQTVRGIKTRTQNVKATDREFIHVKVDFVLGRDCLLFECYLSSVVPSTKTITGCKSSEVKSQVFLYRSAGRVFCQDFVSQICLLFSTL